MSKKSSEALAKYLARLPKHQNLIIGFILANLFSLGVGLLLGQLWSEGKFNFPGVSRYQKVTVAEVETSTPEAKVLPAIQISGTLNLNSATLSQLDSLPGIGSTYAQKIVSARPFSAATELLTRKVIPISIYNKIKDLVSVE